jgi:multidrug efflux pump subunit AcrB
LPEAEARQQAELSTFGFEPGDIVSQVMSFGASKPIAVRLIGTDYDEVRKHAEKIAGELKHNHFLRDVGFEQTLDYPTVEVEIDRELAGLIGITPEHLKRALVMATSSTRFTNLNYWINEHLDTACGILDSAIEALDRRLGGALTRDQHHRREPIRLIHPDPERA